MQRLEPRPDPIPNERLKGFLLHDDPLVRETITFYFHESWSEDEDLAPLLLEACRQHGEEATLPMLGLGTRFPLSEEGLLEAVSELERSQPPFVERWLARAPLELIARYEDRLRGVLSSTAAARIERRQILRDTPTKDLWRMLAAGAPHLDSERGEDDGPWLELDDLLEALSRRQMRPAAVERLLAIGRLSSSAHKRSLVELAGTMQLHEVTRLLVDLLGDPDDALAEAAAESIGRLQTLAGVRRIEEHYPERPWAFRLYAIGALQAIKSPCSEAALRALLEAEDEPALRGRIFDALRFHFTAEAAELIRNEIREPTSWMMAGELQKALFVNAQILGRKDPEAEALRRELDRAGDDGIFFHVPVMEWIDGSDPCPCESGKRYQACCGAC